MFLIFIEFNRKVVDRKNNCEDYWLEDSYIVMLYKLFRYVKFKSWWIFIIYYSVLVDLGIIYRSVNKYMIFIFFI